MLVHSFSSSSTVTHGKNNSCATSHYIATCKNQIIGSLHSITIHNNCAPAGNLQTGKRLWNEWVRGYPNTNNNLINLHPVCCTLNSYRSASSRLVGFTQLHFLQQHPLHSSALITLIS